jgi:hypothetical protein
MGAGTHRACPPVQTLFGRYQEAAGWQGLAWKAGKPVSVLGNLSWNMFKNKRLDDKKSGEFYSR